MRNPFPKILGLIPARMGSKGVPGKNMKLLGGKPLIQYTIEAAMQSELLNYTIVSTDSPAIADFVKRFNRISAPFQRPAHLATDHSPMIQVMQHAAEYANYNFEYMLLLQPTCPLREPGLIDKAISQIIRECADSLVTVRKIPDVYHPFWAYTLRENSFLTAMHNPDVPMISRRQDLPPTYHRDGAIYITHATLIRDGLINAGKISALINENEFGVNIDTISDWAMAENMIVKWKEKAKSTSSY